MLGYLVVKLKFILNIYGLMRRWAASVVVAYLMYAVREYMELNDKCDRCEMSFMRPHYQQVNIDTKLPYRLMEYSEDGRFGPKHLNVYIYVPGNAASFHQVRSIGSRLLHSSADCNVYAVDYREEWSAFEGEAAVGRQAKFLGDVVEWVRRERGERGEVRVTLVGHSMGAVVAKRVGCDCEAVVKIVDLAGPSNAPIPLSFGDYTAITCEKVVKIGTAANDIQAVSKGDIRVDAIPLSWSDPHHQAMVWSHSLVRAVADHLAFGYSLSEFQIGLGGGDYGGICEIKSGLSGTYITNMKVGRHLKIEGDNIKLTVIPGRYTPAQSGRVKSVIPEYLTIISGHDFAIKKYCEPLESRGGNGGGRMEEYWRDGSIFSDMLTPSESIGEDYIENVKVFEKKVYLLPNAYYEKRDQSTLVSIEFPDGTVIHPMTRFLSGPFGKYKITSINKPAECRLDIARTTVHWANLNKREFHKGLVLGFHRRTPFVYCILIALLLLSGNAAISALFGYVLGHSLYTLLFGDHIKFTPIYKYSDDRKGFKELCISMSVLSFMLPYPVGILTFLPIFMMALFDANKRWKALQWSSLLMFEIVSGIACLINNYRSRQMTMGPLLHRIIPVLVNMSMFMHVRSFILLPIVTLLPDMIMPSAIIALGCALAAADHERNQIGNLLKKDKK